MTTAELLLTLEEMVARGPAWVTELPGPSLADPDLLEVVWREPVPERPGSERIVLAAARATDRGVSLQLSALEDLGPRRPGYHPAGSRSRQLPLPTDGIPRPSLLLPGGRNRISDLVARMEGHAPSTQIQVGNLVLVDLPRTRWDHRQGLLSEIRHEAGQPSQGFVYLDCMLVRFPLARLSRA